MILRLCVRVFILFNNLFVSLITLALNSATFLLKNSKLSLRIITFFHSAFLVEYFSVYPSLGFFFFSEKMNSNLIEIGEAKLLKKIVCHKILCEFFIKKKKINFVIFLQIF